MHKTHLIANAVKFQIGWVLVVFYGNTMAAICALLAVLIYGKWFYNGIPDFLLIGATIVLGVLGDIVFGYSKVLVYPSGLAIPPFWMATLWLLFAMTLPWSVRPLMHKRPLFIVFCMIGGPLSYVAGVRLTNVEFGLDRLQAIMLLMAVWAFYGIVLSEFVRRWEVAVKQAPASPTKSIKRA